MAQGVALITGASRGVGAAVARRFAEHREVGTVVINHRDPRKSWMAGAVASQVEAAGSKAKIIRADLTDHDEAKAMVDTLREELGKVNWLVLNASGGLEPWVGQDYAMRINLQAQTDLVELVLPLMPPGSRITFVTSHWAHMENYESDVYSKVARSKRAGELALRRSAQEFAAHGVSLTVVSGDIIADSTVALMLDRLNPGWIQARLDRVGELPDTADFSENIVAVTTLKAPAVPFGQVHTVYVGSTDL